jgi:MFS family permease
VSSKDRYRFVILSLVSLVRNCSGLIWASAGPLLPLIMLAYGINRGAVGWFASAAPISIAILAIPVSIIGAKSSRKKTFAVGALLQAAGILAPFCSNYPLLLLTRAFYAIGTAICFTLGTAILAEWFSSSELPLMNGITISLNNMGNAIAYTTAVPITAFISWRAPMVVYGAFALTCAIAWIIFGKDRQKVPTLSGATPTPILERSAEFSIRQIIVQRSTILLALATMGCWCLGNAMGSWLPSYYHEVFNMPLGKASSITAIFTVSGMVSAVIGGLLSVRAGRRKPFLIIPGICMGLSALGSIFFNNSAVIFVSIACFGIFSNLLGPALFTIPMELENLSVRAGTIVMFIMLVGGNFGNFMGPLFVGYLTDITGSYLPGFIICIVISLSLFVAGLLLPETGPKARKTDI